MVNLLLAFIVAFLSMFIWSISGWIWLLLRPILIFLWFNPILVIWTVRVASLFWEIPTIILLQKSNKIDWKIVTFLLFPMFLWSFISTIFILFIVKDYINYLIWLILLFSGITLLIKKDLWINNKNKNIKINSKINILVFIFTTIISFFNTITGWLWSLFTALYIYVYGKTYISAAALTKTSSYIWSWIASFVFLYSKNFDLKLLIVLILWFLLWSYFWTNYGLKKWNSYLKYITLIIIFMSSIKLLFF